MTLHLRRGENETFLFIGIDEHALAGREVDHVLVRHPVGNRDDHFIARIDQRLHQIEDRVLAADGRDALLRRIGRSVAALVIVADGLFQFHRAADGRVLGEVLPQRFNRRVFDIVGRRKIRLACAEVHYVDTFAALAIRFRGHLHGGRFTDPRDSFR